MSSGTAEGGRTLFEGRMLIDGAWVAKSATYEVRNPAAPHELVAVFPCATADDVGDALISARAAFESWSRRSQLARGQVLGDVANLIDAQAEELAVDLTREEGKAIRDSRAEVRRSAEILRYYAGECRQPVGETYASIDPDTQLSTTREPLGVVGVVTPWNFPVALPLWKIAPALAFGNTVVWKPASSTPLAASRLTRIFCEAGLPAGALNLLTGSAAEIGDPLVKHPDLDAISFTGSAPVGYGIRRAVAGRAVKIQLELGGKNAAVVLSDGDLELAADLIVRGSMGSTGQRCTATSRAIVADDVFDKFADLLLDRIATLRIGEPLDDDTDIGPLASHDQFEKVHEYLQVGQSEGIDFLVDGANVDRPNSGYFVGPSVYLDRDSGSRLTREEVFGPVLGLIPVSSPEAALEVANATPYGLSASVFTNDLRQARRFANGLRVGVVRVNGETAGVESHVPFGGMKESSSHSREQGKAARDFFTDVKTVYVTT